MRALVYVGPERLEMQDWSKPVRQPGEILVKVAAAGICGSDIHGFLGHSSRRTPPLILGHEAVATIAEVDPSSGRWRSGQRVCINPLITCGSCPACLAGKQNLCRQWRILSLDRLHGTYTEWLSLPAAQLYPVSDGIDALEVVCTEPLANVVHFFRLALGEPPPETLAIFGAGAVGILSLMLAKLRGIPWVGVVDRNEKRLEIARQLGAEPIWDGGPEMAAEVIRRRTGGEGAEVAVEAVGVSGTRRAAVSACRRGGKAVFVGLAENECSLPFLEMIRDEKQILTTFAYTPTDFAAALRLIESGAVRLGRWTQSCTLEEGQDAFLKMSHDPGATLKMVLRV